MIGAGRAGSFPRCRDRVNGSRIGHAGVDGPTQQRADRTKRQYPTCSLTVCSMEFHMAS
jgi:hypothetical protein